MSTAAQNLTCFRASRFRINFVGTGLSAADVALQLLSAHGDSPLLTLTEGSGVTVTSATEGYADLTAAHTDRTPSGTDVRYYYTISDRTADDLLAHGELTILAPRVAD